MLAVDAELVSQVQTALEASAHTAQSGDVPVGAAVFNQNGELVSIGYNTREAANSFTGHAEIMALQAAATAQGNLTLTGHTLAITLEPCAMCAAVILKSRVHRVVFGAWDDKAGAAGSVYDLLRDGRLPHPVPEVIGGVLADQCAAQLTEFFAAMR